MDGTTPAEILSLQIRSSKFRATHGPSTPHLQVGTRVSGSACVRLVNAPPAPGCLCFYFSVGIWASGYAYLLLSVSGYMTGDGSSSS